MILRLEKERKVSSPFYFHFFKLISGCGGTADALVSGSSEEIRVGSNPVIRTKQRGRALVVRPLCFIRVVGFEIGRKLRSNLSVGPNSPVDCLSAKAATGGNPVISCRHLRSAFLFYSIRSLRLFSDGHKKTEIVG